MSLTPFRYETPTPGLSTLYLTNARPINGLSSFMWIERYRTASEFTIKAPVSSNLRFLLPLGSLMSHTDTQELMIVESHEISENTDGDVEICVTGRSFETFMEQRVLSHNSYADDLAHATINTYAFGSVDKAAAHTVALIEYNLRTGMNPSTLITNCRAVSTVPVSIGVAESRELKITDLYTGVLSVLAVDDLGIRSVRPGPLSQLPTATDVGFVIHRGEDKSETVSFDYSSGDIKNAQYLWTIKNEKNAALTQGTNYQMVVSPSGRIGYELRVGYVDAKNVDVQPLNSTTEAALLTSKANSYLGEHKASNIARVEISPTATRLKYRKDYNVGDIVSVYGNYDTYGKMRVVEHVEIIDSTGQSSYPTLEAI